MLKRYWVRFNRDDGRNSFHQEFVCDSEAELAWKILDTTNFYKNSGCSIEGTKVLRIKILDQKEIVRYNHNKERKRK